MAVGGEILNETDQKPSLPQVYGRGAAAPGPQNPGIYLLSHKKFAGFSKNH